ncbi:MAG: AMP-binding protein [Proteobacteria bacterium]|nr:AMP-binding protein [Pseudomonadota bacterium]
MTRLTDYTRYADAHRHYSKQALWELFDGDKDALNIAHECVDRHAGQGIEGDVAVRVAHADGRDEVITFTELAALSGRVASYFVARGVKPGERVAMMLEPSLAFYAALFGAMKMGAVAVPLFTLFGPEGLRLRMADCNPALLLLAPDKQDLAAEAGAEVVMADDAWLAHVARLPVRAPIASRADDMALYQYTSGTTRELPEAVKHRHRAIVTVAIAALYATGVRPGDRYMCPSSPAWGHGLWHGTLAPLGLGVSIAAYAGKFDAERLLEAIADYRITNLSAAATHYRLMKNSGAAARHRYALKKLTFTGEPIDSATAAWAEQTFGSPVCSIYGTTEVGVIIANYPGADDLPVKPGALGKAVPGVEVAVLDRAGQPCAPGAIGEIMLRRGDGWFPTKDLGHIDEDGYFYHNGRADDVIISAGWTMSAVEIEDTLLKHPDVAECAAIGVPDATRGQVVKAYVVSPRAASDAFITEIQQFAQQRLSRHEYPRQVEFVSELPKTPAGKVNRNVLRARVQEKS